MNYQIFPKKRKYKRGSQSKSLHFSVPESVSSPTHWSEEQVRSLDEKPPPQLTEQEIQFPHSAHSPYAVIQWYSIGYQSMCE